MAVTSRLAERLWAYRYGSLPGEMVLDPQTSAHRPPIQQIWPRRYATAVLAMDAAAAASAGAVALTLHRDSDRHPVALAAAAVVAVVAWVLAIAVAGGYEYRFLGIGSEEYRRVALGALGLIATFATVSWAVDVSIGRSYLLVALPLALGLTLVGRYGWRKRVHYLRRAGRYQHRTIVLGPIGPVRDLVGHLHASSHHGYEVVGTCLTDVSGECSDIEEVPVLGCTTDVAAAVSRVQADTVVITSGAPLAALDVRHLSWELEPTGANLIIAPALMDVAGPRTAVRPVEGLPLLHVEQPQLSGTRRVVKALYDPLVAAGGLLVLLPVLALIAAAIKLDSPGPVLFRQRRVGHRGREFTLIKFRTMVTDADRLKDDLASDGPGPLFKLRHDPRVTSVGRLLRRTSLDELPQLVNVMRGEMSLVGPRPHLPQEVDLFGSDLRRRLLVKPGLTGLWQVSGRSDLSLEESTRVDLRYVENWSLALDATILWKTLSAVVRGSGAY